MLLMYDASEEGKYKISVTENILEALPTTVIEVELCRLG